MNDRNAVVRRLGDLTGGQSSNDSATVFLRELDTRDDVGIDSGGRLGEGRGQLERLDGRGGGGGRRKKNQSELSPGVRSVERMHQRQNKGKAAKARTQGRRALLRRGRG